MKFAIVRVLILTALPICAQQEMEVRFGYLKEYVNSSLFECSFYDTVFNKRSDTLKVDYIKRDTRMPSGWGTYLCDEKTCYPSTDTMHETVIKPNGSMAFINHIYFPDNTANDSAVLTIVVRNKKNPAEFVQQNLIGMVSPNIAIKMSGQNAAAKIFKVLYTGNKSIVVKFSPLQAADISLRLFSMDGVALTGRMVPNMNRNLSDIVVNTQSLSRGMYLVAVKIDKQTFTSRILIGHQ